MSFDWRGLLMPSEGRTADRASLAAMLPFKRRGSNLWAVYGAVQDLGYLSWCPTLRGYREHYRSVRSCGEIVYTVLSYRTPIAWVRAVRDTSERVYVPSNSVWSRTTNNHRAVARDALHADSDLIRCQWARAGTFARRLETFIYEAQLREQVRERERRNAEYQRLRAADEAVQRVRVPRSAVSSDHAYDMEALTRAARTGQTIPLPPENYFTFEAVRRGMRAERHMNVTREARLDLHGVPVMVTEEAEEAEPLRPHWGFAAWPVREEDEGSEEEESLR